METMNNSPQDLRIRWFWFGISSALLSSLVCASSLLRWAMIWLVHQYRADAMLPQFTNILLFNGPLDLRSMGAGTLFIFVTLIGMGLLLRGNVKENYLIYMPVVGSLIGLLYLTLLSVFFLLPFIRIPGGIYTAEHPMPTPIPAPSVPPELWLIGSLMYLTLMIMAVVAAKRKERRSEQK